MKTTVGPAHHHLKEKEKAKHHATHSQHPHHSHRTHAHEPHYHPHHHPSKLAERHYEHPRHQSYRRILAPDEKLLFIQHPAEHDFDEHINPHAHDDVLRLTRGIYIMEEWWRKQHIAVSFYLTDYNQYYLEGINELEEYVRAFHQTIAPHQQIEDKTLIFGVGATQLLHAAIYALCIKHATHTHEKHHLYTRPLYFTHQLPGYLDTQLLIESFSSFNSRWIHFADHRLVPHNDLVEFVTCPNNPDGRFLQSQTHAKYVVHDRVNLWPFFMTNQLSNYYQETLENDQITIFSLAKLLSFSGSRVGYALVSDPEIARYMKYFVIRDTHGVAADGELRCLSTLRFLIDNNRAHEYVDWLSNEFKKRWDILSKAIKDTPMKLVNGGGATVWIHTPQRAEKYVFDHYHILGTYGPEYGASDHYIRLNLQCTEAEFNEFLFRLHHPLK